ncbi:hypothetical protein DPMN_128547 [Dreissena polymorpha]|uniref:Uncharacterized protein n=1 Tax=Dreissena polymorpha TaxID=45954 RepID=A0A9D4K093_DREPO|nr:hypothetical protein DPMN_128547 [Dreissena polymorpha]
MKENSRLFQTVPQTSRAPLRDSQKVCDDAKTILLPAGDSKTVSDSLPDRRTNCRKFQDSQRLCQGRLGTCCQDRLGTSRRLPDGAKRLPDRRFTCKRLTPKSLR